MIAKAKRLTGPTKAIASLIELLNRDEGLGRRLVGGTWWLTVGVGVYSLATLLTSVVLARLLGIQQFGNYTILMTTLGVLFTLAGPAIGYTASKYVSEHRHSNPEKAGRVVALTNLMALTFSLICALAMVLGAGYIAREILEVPAIRVDLMVASVAVLFAGVNGAQRGTLSGLQRFREIAVVNIVQGVLLVALLYPLVPPYGIMGAVIAQGSAIAGSCFVGNLLIRRELHRLSIPHRHLPRREDFSIFGGFALPSYLLSITAMISSWIVGVLVVRSPNGSYEMGVFGVTTQIFLACMFLPTMISQPCVPLLAEQLQHGVEKRAAIRRLLALMVFLSFLVTLVVALVLLLSGHYTLGIFGGDLAKYYSLLVITTMTALLAGTLGPLNYYMTARGDVWLAVGIALVGIIVNIAILVTMRDASAAAGAVWGRLMSYLTILPIVAAYVFRTLRSGARWSHGRAISAEGT